MSKNDKYRHLIILFLCGFLLLSTGASAADKVLDASRLDQGGVSLTEYFAVLEDPGTTLTLEDVQKPDMASRFKADNTPAEALNYGLTDSAYWLRLTLSNTGDHPVERMLEIGTPLISNIQFHRPGADGTYQSITTGIAPPFAERPYKNRFFVFPVTLPAHSDQVIYLRLRSISAMIIPVKLWMPQDFHVHERDDYVAQAWYFGMATAMILFNLLLFIALRDVIYLLYVCFVASAAFILALQNGLIKEFILHDASQWSYMAIYAGHSLAGLTTLMFMRHMLTTWAVVPKLDRLLKFLVGIYLLLPFGIVVSYQNLVIPITRLHLVTIALIIGTSLFCAYKRQRSATFFIAAFAMLFVGAAMTVMKDLRLLPANTLTINGLQFGSALEMLLLAFALADRFNMIRRKATDDVKQANVNLEQRLQAREAELAIKHEKLRESEEFLREAQHIAGLGSYVLDIPGGRWRGTDSIPQMFGMDASYEQTYEAWAKLIHPDDRAMITGYFANLILTRNPIFDKEYRIIRQDNQAVRWLHGIGRLTFDAQGQPTKMLGTIRDVTEQHEREAELTAAHERLRVIEQRQTLSQERQRLMQDMHDGLGSSLVSALRVVEHGRMDEAEVAQVLQGCIDDLQLAIDSMEPVEADLLLLLATLRYRLGPRLESTGIALRWEVENIPALDWLDPKNALHILRILQEAFTNTIKHTRATQIRVATRVEGDQVLVSITDNGQGFDVESALKSGGKGLSNQMRRAQAIGAEVKWDSGDAGTCFTLRLPIKQGSATRA